MAQAGLRLLSLDGGGTRGLSTLYTLREVLNAVVHGNGGHVRPCEYFDLIGGSSLSGLCALLFARFSYTIDEAIEFLHDVSQKLDDAESFYARVLKGDVEDAEDWLECVGRHRGQVEQLEALRQGLIQDCWSGVIERNITDGLEQYLHMENGKFDFKNPSAVVESGRSKAFVVSSESQGYGNHGGVSDDRRYNVPILHRTYDCRHGSELYTFYAVGLSTVASPDIMKPGVIFPDFLATGKHSVHNPVHLVLEESAKLWPGLRISALLSIGTGIFELTRWLSNSKVSGTAKACLEIARENERLAAGLKKFVLPFDKSLAQAYFRLNNPTPTAYYEYSARVEIQSEVTGWLKEAREATICTYAANELKRDNFPTSPEDLLALTSLATLLHGIIMAESTHDAEILNDMISNFILYEAASGEDGSFRKIAIASEAEQIANRIHNTRKAFEGGQPTVPDRDLRSESAILTGLMAFGEKSQDGTRPPGELRTLSDYAAGAYYLVVVLRKGDRSEMEKPRLRKILRQLSSLLKLPAEVTQQFATKMESLLELVCLAALCKVGTLQALRGFKCLSYNGPLIRRIHSVLQSTPMENVSQMIIQPIADLFAINIRMNNWSLFRDDAIINLFTSASASNKNSWSLVNLALERQYAGRLGEGVPTSSLDVLSACQHILERHSRTWETTLSEIQTTSVDNGWFALLWKCLRWESLTNDVRIPAHPHFSVIQNAAFHRATKNGFPYILKKFLEGLGMDRCRDIVKQRNHLGQTPLHLACMHRAPKEVFHILGILGADVNSACRLGRTPLHYCFPSQKAIPSVHDAVMKMMSDHALPTIAPLDLPKPYGIYGKEEDIDPRVNEFRLIINRLLRGNADISVSDQDGLTPVHLAAKEGWGDNIDLFFLSERGDSERLQRASLTIRDDAGLSVLDYARMTGTNRVIKGGEDVIIAEMSKRGIDIPDNCIEPALPLDFEVRKLMTGRRTPISDSRPRDPVKSSSKAVPIASEVPGVTPFAPPPPPRFPPPQVYQDPDFAGSGSSSASSSSPQLTAVPPNTETSWRWHNSPPPPPPPPPVSYGFRTK